MLEKAFIGASKEALDGWEKLDKMEKQGEDMGEASKEVNEQFFFFLIIAAFVYLVNLVKTNLSLKGYYTDTHL